MEWLLFLPQLPATPSSLRVSVWRRLRALGALGLQNGVWLLPAQPSLLQMLQALREFILSQGGEAFLLRATPEQPNLEAFLQARFHAERDEEYGEFLERCREFLGEIARETQHEKFTFAELEEIEEDLHKLEHWLTKIRARDFFGAPRASEAVEALQICRREFAGFAAQVYARQGLEAPSPETLDNPYQEDAL